jgi:hypothetical protein
MQAQQELEQIEISIEQAREKIALAEAVTRLRNNADFKLVFVETYLKRNALWLVEAKANPEKQDELNQTFIEKQLNAIGQLSQYLQYVAAEGFAASAQIDADEREREVILREAL